MPMWGYICEEGHESQELKSYDSREEPTTCPECGKQANFKQTFCTNVKFGESYNSFHSNRHKWNLRENKRLGTKGKNYD